MTNITGVLTSCRRPDLLDSTLTSLLTHAPDLASRLIVIEDSDGAEVSPVMARFPATIRYIVNGGRMGQRPSIDRAYGMVETDYIFHCEDDWRFYRSGFLAESLQLLETFQRASVIGVRRTGGDGGHDRLVLAQGVSVEQGLAFRWLEAAGDRPGWGGYSFNPGLRRKADWLAMGPFAKFASEYEVSAAFRKAGRAMIQLEHSACEHIGRGRHVGDVGEKKPLAKRLKRLLGLAKKPPV
ncbi:hypothetical protein [Aestuariivirga sp.]|uniref:hypothetical protein n=1 Tax=Aestuariivirga sp. TaxID=2650926 RepID=UPI0025C1ABB5|nr:hypothetical protein [Aestuariivirga sp.]MCA3556047.1 hypothetical protein [Aestuariivirga sp.]